MADTTKIKTIIEPYLTTWLSTQFPGHIFKGRLVQLPTGEAHAFDAVAGDGSIVGAILCNRASTRSGKVNTGAVRKALVDASYLKMLPTDVKKLMVFTDTKFSELVRRRARRLGTESIEMIVCRLPNAKASLLRQILDQASNEQRARATLSASQSRRRK